MGRRKIGEEHVRKIMRTGRDGSSYAVTLPKRMVRELGWKERQKVEVVRKGDTIVITDWEA